MVIWESHRIFCATSQMLGCKILKKLQNILGCKLSTCTIVRIRYLRDPVEMRSHMSKHKSPHMSKQTRSSSPRTATSSSSCSPVKEHSMEHSKEHSMGLYTSSSRSPACMYTCAYTRTRACACVCACACASDLGGDEQQTRPLSTSPRGQRLRADMCLCLHVCPDMCPDMCLDMCLHMCPDIPPSALPAGGIVRA